MMRFILVPVLISVFSLFLTTNLLSQQELPNIVWIVTEDNSIHYSSLYSDKGALMPTIQALAKRGIQFNNAFSQAPVCSVARSTIISACYAPRVGTQYHRKEQIVSMPEGLNMFPWYLRQAGYYTTNNSKEDYNFIKQEGVWDESSRQASYRNRKPNQAFFHVQNFGISHEGQLHFTKEEMAQNPTSHDPSTVEPFPCYPNTSTFRYTHAKYLDQHQKVDEAIRKFMAELEADGVLDNTIIFYYGDHGGVLPGSKGYVYERGVHVPLVVAFPEKWQHLAPVKMGTKVDAFVRFIDLGPTVLHLADVEPPDQMDGRPFLGKHISEADLALRNEVFSYADRFDEKYDLVRAIRRGKFKYIRNYQPFNFDGLHNFYRYKMLAYQEWRDLYKAGKLNAAQAQFFEARPAEALYDVEQDPFELNNLATQEKYQSMLIELRGALQEKVKSMPDLSFFPESYFIIEGAENPVAFGQARKEEIANLVAIADLSLKPYKKVKQKIKKALRSKNPWERYWGLIVCSSFRTEAADFYEKAKIMAQKDSENLVRVRAAEFLAFTKQQAPQTVLLECLKAAKSHTEANLILNTVVLLQDSNTAYTFEIKADLFPKEWIDRKNSLVFRRLEYLNP